MGSCKKKKKRCLHKLLRQLVPQRHPKDMTLFPATRLKHCAILRQESSLFKNAPGNNIFQQVGCLSTLTICFISILILSLLSFVAYPAIRKQSPPSTSYIHSPVTTKQESEEQQRLPCSVTVWSNLCIHIPSPLCEA